MAQSERQWTRAEVKEAGKNGDVHFVIYNYVYSVKKFLDEHPGGHEVLVAVSGADASEEFEDVGHSLDAKDMMKPYCVGQIVEAERSAIKSRTAYNSSSDSQADTGFMNSWKLPLVLGILATVIYSYLFG